MAAVLKHWRESATLILATSKASKKVAINLAKATDNNNNSNTVGHLRVDAADDSDDNFDILMMKRSSSSKFMPNLHVFPGGVAENSDFSSQWISVFKKLGSDIQKQLFSIVTNRSNEAAPIITRQRNPEFSALPADVAFRICAIREAFEESGVLLAKPPEVSKHLVEQQHARLNHRMAPLLNKAFMYEDAQVMRKWRERVNKEPGQFLEMCLQLDLVPEIWSLHEWANWLTPIRGTENRRRFDTIFYICCVDYKPEAEQDHGETVNVLWASPSSFLSAHVNQEGGLAPPQIYELTRLLNFTSADDLLTFVSQPDRSRVGRFFPVEATCQDSHFSINPGDSLYPERPDYVSQKPLLFDQTLAELNTQYLGHNRLCLDPSFRIVTVDYTIQPKAGHAPPRMDFMHKLLRAKL